MAGADEILNRRIGRNELSVIQVSRAYVAAQRDYAARNLGPGGAAEYAQHFMSTIGQRDGLYWPVKPGEEESPLGPLIAQARAAGYRPGTPHVKPRPYDGYYFRILTQQGPNAAGGARNYVVNNHMTGGFAMITFPATYGDSGIMTFIVNQDGIVYQKNLGPDTTSRCWSAPSEFHFQLFSSPVRLKLLEIFNTREGSHETTYDYTRISSRYWVGTAGDSATIHASLPLAVQLH